MTVGNTSGGSATWAWRIAATASLVLLDAAAIASLTRIFDATSVGDSWVRGAFALILATHVAFLLLGRLGGVGWAAATLASLGIGVLATTRWFYGSTTRVGLPTPSSIDGYLTDLRLALEPLGYELAPIPLDPAIAATITLGAVVLAATTHVLAFAVRSRGATVAMPLAIFLFSSVIATGIDTAATTVAVLGSAALFWITHGSFGLAGLHGPASVSPSITRASFAGGLVTIVLGGALGLGATAAIAPEQGDESLDLLALGRAPAPRTVLSPLVRVSSLLRGNEGEIGFTVRSDRPHYWRLTSLDTFDGDAWTSSATYDDLSRDDVIALPFAGGQESETAEVTLDDFETDWIPVPFAPRSAASEIGLRVDEESSSLFVDDPDDGAAGARIEVVAVAPPPDGTAATGDAPVLSPGDTERLLELPAETSATVSPIVEDLLADDPDDIVAARRIQDYFRDPARFRYDLFADYSDRDDPLRDFLADGAGFCQQFASSFAAMAREAGLPTRVAVGFTYGTASGPESDLWRVEARNAHAWPEVFIDGTGWLPFEPTPGRGNPDVVALTGVPAQQDDGGSPQTETTTTVATTATSGNSPGAPTTTVAAPSAVPPTPTSDTGAGSDPLVPPALAIILLVGSGLVLGRWLVVRTRRRRALSPGRDPELAVAELYRRAVDDAARLGVTPRAADTPLHFGATAAEELGAPEFSELGALESDRRYSPDSPGPSEVSDAARAAAAVTSVVRQRLGRPGRIRMTLDV